jgi:hypothetical protein
MKTIIITISSLALLSSLCDAQTKPVFNPDGNHKLQFAVNVTAAQINSYIIVLQNGGPEQYSKSHNFGDVIAANLTSYSIVADSVATTSQRVFTEWLKKEQVKFTADTTKSNHR